MSRKKRKSSCSLFAFVWFAQKTGAQNAIANLDGTVITGCRIKVKIVEYMRNGVIRKAVNKEELKPQIRKDQVTENNNFRERQSYREVLAPKEIRTNRWVSNTREKKVQHNTS